MGYKRRRPRSREPVCRPGPAFSGFFARSVQEILVFIILMMLLSISAAQVFLLSTLLHLSASLPVRDEEEVESFLTQMRLMDGPVSPSEIISGDALLEARLRQLLSSGLDRRRQLGDLEFSNRYAEFLRSKAKHSSICSFLHRIEGGKKSGVGGEVERVNLLLRQYMCPSVHSSWSSNL